MCIDIRIRSTQEQDERVMWDGRTIFELHNRISHGALLILIAPYSYIQPAYIFIILPKIVC